MIECALQEKVRIRIPAPTRRNNNIKTKQTKNQRKKGSKPDCTCFTYGLVYAMGCRNDQYQKAQTPKASHSTAQAESPHNKALLGKSVFCFKGFQNQMSHGNIYCYRSVKVKLLYDTKLSRFLCKHIE